MQDYRDWVARWLGMDGPSGRLATLVHEDDRFPSGADKQTILARLNALGIDEGARVVFLGNWKHYEADRAKKPREVTLERKLVRGVEKHGGLCWKFTSPGTVGVPDRVVMAAWGKVAFVEMKAPGKKLRPIQRRRAEQLQDIGVPVYCLSSDKDIADFLREMFEE
jgi:hypothetical protein